jgi:hypothetical protein
MLLAHFLTYHHVWEHHYSGVLVLVLLGLGRVGPTPWLSIPAVLLALPTPFVLLDTSLDPAVADPSTSWSWWGRALLPACKVVPTWIAAIALLRSGTTDRSSS